MNPSGVAKAGNDLRQTAEEADTRTKALFESSDAAADGNDGWASSDALRTAGRRWREHLAGLTGQTLHAAEDLLASAASVSDADRESARRLDEVLHELAGE